MTRPRSHGLHQESVPETLADWLDKWEPKVKSLQRRRRERTSRADGALDELEFLLARTVENRVTE